MDHNVVPDFFGDKLTNKQRAISLGAATLQLYTSLMLGGVYAASEVRGYMSAQGQCISPAAADKHQVGQLLKQDEAEQFRDKTTNIDPTRYYTDDYDALKYQFRQEVALDLGLTLPDMTPELKLLFPDSPYSHPKYFFQETPGGEQRLAAPNELPIDEVIEITRTAFARYGIDLEVGTGVDSDDSVRGFSVENLDNDELALLNYNLSRSVAALSILPKEFVAATGITRIQFSEFVSDEDVGKYYIGKGHVAIKFDNNVMGAPIEDILYHEFYHGWDERACASEPAIDPDFVALNGVEKDDIYSEGVSGYTKPDNVLSFEAIEAVSEGKIEPSHVYTVTEYARDAPGEDKAEIGVVIQNPKATANRFMELAFRESPLADKYEYLLQRFYADDPRIARYFDASNDIEKFIDGLPIRQAVG